MKNKVFMIDIETTGVNKKEDEILEIGLVELEKRKDSPYYHLTGRRYHRILHYGGKPETAFAKQHMGDLYKKCNEVDPSINYSFVCDEVCAFVHDVHIDYIKKEPYIEKSLIPKFFMGWNASNFDIPFMFAKGLLTPSWYQTQADGSEELRGDVHYRILEQTGSLQLAIDVSGFNRKTIKALCEELNPTDIKLPKGKQHDALYDCYWQTIMQNGLIELGRRGWIK